MSWIRRAVGLDGVDLLIHAGVTFFRHGDREHALVARSRRDHARDGQRSCRWWCWASGGIGRSETCRLETTGDLAAERIAELEARVGELEQAESRMHELEERLDFAERLLAQAREPERLA